MKKVSLFILSKLCIVNKYVFDLFIYSSYLVGKKEIHKLKLTRPAIKLKLGLHCENELVSWESTLKDRPIS